MKNPTTSPVLQRTLSAASVPKPGRPAVLPTHKKATSRSVASLVEAHEDNALSSAPKSSTSQNVEGATLKRPASEIQTSGMAAPRPRKTRLIDRLSAQKAGSSSESEYESDTDRGWDADEGDLEQGAPSASQTAPLTPRSKRAALLDREIWTRPAHTHAGLSASKKVKHTYSQSRSIRSDAQPGGNDVFGVSGDLGNNPLLLSPSKPSPGPFAPPVDEFDLDGSDDEDRTIAIKSVHELRRAGANNRFADEMEDLLSRIGTPRSPTSSMRRNALLELAQKLQQQDFSLQFRDHSARDTIAKKVGDEQDIVSGFAITASLVMFLSFNNAPNLLRQLMEERVGELLGRLLRVQEDVGSIAKQRTANLSKHGRGVVNDVKAHLQRMDIWHGRQPTGLSPRSIALQLHYILQRNLEARHRGDMIKRLEKDFAIIAEDQALHAPLNDSLAPLVVLIMEAELGAATAVLTPSQLRQRASNTALFLQATLAKWPGDRGEKQSATLKLAIDTTNTEVGAEAFGNAPLLAAVARAVSQGLDEVQRAAHSQSFDAGLYDGLLLVLGIMINVLEHSPRARASIDTASTEKLAELFLQNRKSVAAVSKTEALSSSKVTNMYQGRLGGQIKGEYRSWVSGCNTGIYLP